MPLAPSRRVRIAWGEEQRYEKLSNYFDGSRAETLTKFKDSTRKKGSGERR